MTKLLLSVAALLLLVLPASAQSGNYTGFDSTGKAASIGIDDSNNFAMTVIGADHIYILIGTIEKVSWNREEMRWLWGFRSSLWMDGVLQDSHPWGNFFYTPAINGVAFDFAWPLPGTGAPSPYSVYGW
jgi:hypothetical protein